MCGTPTRFNPVFITPTLSPTNVTFYAVLTGGYSNIAKLVVAAALNQAQGLVPVSVLPLARIIHIWQDWNNGAGSYSPSPGFSWNTAEIEDYLRSTMTSS